MNRRGNSGLLNNMEASHQENENNEGTACYAEIQTDRINVKGKANGVVKRLSVSQDETEKDEITPYGTSLFSSPKGENKYADEVGDIDPCGTSSITNPNPVNYTNQDDGEIKNAEEIEEIDPYGTSSIKSVNDNQQEEKEINVMKDSQERKPVAGKPVTSDMYATVDKKGKNKLERQDVDPMEFYAVVNKQKQKGKESANRPNDDSNKEEEMQELYAEVDKSKKKEKPASKN